MDLSKQGEARDFRKGNWTVEETMVLIEAKKMDEERRMKRLGHGGESARGKPAELRWKWVEDYCSKRGCFRSQNQCNDKWDNMMRDFKRVREYEAAAAAGGGGDKSYWRIEKNERKEKNLPSSMLREIYEALMEATEKSPRFATTLVQPSLMPPHPPPLTQVDPPTHPPPPPPPPPEKTFSHTLPTVG